MVELQFLLAFVGLQVVLVRTSVKIDCEFTITISLKVPECRKVLRKVSL